MYASPLRRHCAIISQASLVLAGVATLTLWPPREGPMVLIALDGRDAGRLVGPALDAGAVLAGRGPMSNMIIVNGARAELALLAWRGVIAIAAPRGLCGPGIAA